MQNDNFFENIKGIQFKKRPIPVPYKYRINYKIVLIVLIIGMCSRKSACSLIKIHILTWALNSEKDMNSLARFLNSENQINQPVLRLDPSVNRAISFGVAENVFFQTSNGKYALTGIGEKVYSEIIESIDILAVEKGFLKSIASKLPEKKIDAIVADWRIFSC